MTTRPLREALASLPVRATLTLTALLSAATVPLVFAVGGGVGLAVDTGQQVLASVVVVALLIRIDRRSRTLRPERAFMARGVALTTAFGGLALFAWWIPFADDMVKSSVGDVLVAAGLVTIVVFLGRGVFRDTPRPVLARIGLDTIVVLAASITVLWLLWNRWITIFGAGDVTNTLAGIVALAVPLTGALVLLDRGVPVRLSGPFAILVGMALIGVAMVGFEIAQSAAGPAFVPLIAPTDYAYTAGVLFCGYGAATWTPLTYDGAQQRTATQAFLDALPPLMAALCLGLLLFWPTGAENLEALKVGTGLTAALTVARQMIVTRNERLALAAHQKSSAALERELRTREAVLRSLSRIEVANTLEQTAAHVCREALAIDGIDVAVLVGFMPGQQAVLLGGTNVSGAPGGEEFTFPAPRAAELYGRAALGPWIEDRKPDSAPPGRSIFPPGIHCVVHAPLTWKDETLGVISLGSLDASDRNFIGERVSTAREFGVVAGALMGPMLEERAKVQELRVKVQALIDGHEFVPVFQPIVDLASRRIVGFEALTRFADGRRPDLWFADAAMAGLGIKLEVATMVVAQEHAEFLPADAYVSINVSPALAMAFVPLVATLESARREIVIEITEQEKVGREAYAALRNAVEHLRSRYRIAMDDAGAGYAGLQRIVEIRPKIVKLDVGLVRGVTSDPGRRALISSMVAFASETNCSLVAEGVETEAELGTLRALGVKFGQGYLFGKAAAVEAFATSSRWATSAERRGPAAEERDVA